MRTREEYHRFSKAAGLPEQHERMEKAGFTWKHGKAAEKAAKEHISGVKAVQTKHNQPQNTVQMHKLNSQYRLADGSFDIQEAKKDYAEFLTRVPEKNRILLEQSFTSVEYEQTKLETASFGYSHKRDRVLFDPTRNDFWDLDFTVANTHELAHRIDVFFVQSSNNTAFCEAIRDAQSAILADPKKFQHYCEQNDEHGFLSDICSALSSGKYVFPTGHSSEYWAKPGAMEKEIFANLFSIETFDDSNKLDFIRDNFQSLHKAYQEIEFEVI